MSLVVRFLVEAEDDFDRITEFLQAAAPHAVPDMVEMIFSALDTLSASPDIGRPVRGRPRFRELILRFGRGAYVLRYRAGGDTLYVVRIFHSRENRD